MPRGVFVRIAFAAAAWALWCAPVFAEPSDGRIVIIALGDSTTAGNPFFRSPVEAPPDGEGDAEAPFPFWMEKARPDWKVVNLGVGGERSDPMRRRLGPALDKWKPQALIVLAGVNDLYQNYPAEHVQKNLEAMYREAAGRGVPVVACTVLPYEGQGQAVRERMLFLNRWIEEYSRENGLIFCDTATVAADPQDPSRLGGSPDGLHPDKAHYRKMAEALVPAVEKALLSNKSQHTVNK